MNTILDHLNQISVLGESQIGLFLIIGINFSISLLHTIQEWRGSGGPIWKNFGAIVGVRIPNWFGFSLFTLGLTLALWMVGMAAFTSWLPIVGQVSMSSAIKALGILLGARISDTIISHLLLHYLGYQPNPGLSSTLLYVAEVIFILVAFQKGLSAFPEAAWSGFLIGFLFFVFVFSSLFLLRLFPSWTRKPWIRKESIPDWTRS